MFEQLTYDWVFVFETIIISNIIHIKLIPLINTSTIMIHILHGNVWSVMACDLWLPIFDVSQLNYQLWYTCFQTLIYSTVNFVLHSLPIEVEFILYQLMSFSYILGEDFGGIKFYLN